MTGKKAGKTRARATPGKGRHRATAPPGRPKLPEICDESVFFLWRCLHNNGGNKVSALKQITSTYQPALYQHVLGRMHIVPLLTSDTIFLLAGLLRLGQRPWHQQERRVQALQQAEGSMRGSRALSGPQLCPGVWC